MAAGPSVLSEQSWQERLFVTITQKGGNDKDFHALASEVDFSGGAKDEEGQPLLNGGRQRVRTAQEDFEVSMTLYFTGVEAEPGSSTEPTGLASWFHGSSDSGSNSSVHEYETSLTRPDLRVVVLATNDSDVTSAVDKVGAGSSIQGYRWYAEDVTLTEYEQSFDDNVLTVEVTFLVSPFDAQGNALVFEQEYTGDSSDTLASLGSY